MSTKAKSWMLFLSTLLIVGLLLGSAAYILIVPDMRAEQEAKERKQAMAAHEAEIKKAEASQSDLNQKKVAEQKPEYPFVQNDTKLSELVQLNKYSRVKEENYYATTPLLINKEDGTKAYEIVGPKEILIKSGTLNKLVNADKLLYAKGYRIVVYCAYRDKTLQTYLRQHYENITLDIDGGFNYVARVGASRHQQGQAVDITIETLKGEQNNPTPYLEFTPAITVEANKNHPTLKILEEAMVASGFEIYDGEWWHFDDKESY